MQWKAQQADNDKIDLIEKIISHIHYMYNYRSLLCYKVNYACKTDRMKNRYFITLNDHFWQKPN